MGVMGGVGMTCVPTRGEPTADEASRGRVHRWPPSPDTAIGTGLPGALGPERGRPLRRVTSGEPERVRSSGFHGCALPAHPPEALATDVTAAPASGRAAKGAETEGAAA
ncbi:hypothetical protein GCM10009602_15260 [Nocardiopsis tropica]|uniref:Uncharacterized protein n=2 Tax=Nocardiopsidaceae TaxID=83676 RepID=A0A840WTC9_9ACTN|nr:hypothetical protein [Nocardiopsis metallicus]PSK87514.1 hypothetical protein CLV63_13167 [Murinocardiopsis flavida]